jgi:cyclase
MAEETKNTAYQYPKPEPLKIRQIRDGIYLATGGLGANTGFFNGKDTVVAIDSKMTKESGKEFYEGIEKITGKPVGYMILTHSDLDHVNGLEGFPRDMKIMAHPSVKRDMITSAAAAIEMFRAPQGYLPDVTFTDELEFKVGKEFIQLLHFGPAHTGGDTVVFFKGQAVAFTGDLVTIGREPLIHANKGGSSYGLLKNLKAIAGLEADIFICGHSEPVGKKQIEEFADSVEEKHMKVSGLIKEGRSLDEVKKMLNVVERPPLASGLRFPTLVESIYIELTSKK